MNEQQAREKIKDLAEREDRESVVREVTEVKFIKDGKTTTFELPGYSKISLEGDRLTIVQEQHTQYSDSGYETATIINTIFSTTVETMWTRRVGYNKFGEQVRGGDFLPELDTDEENPAQAV